MKTFFNNLLLSHDPTSSKRFVGLVGAMSLVISMFIYNSDILINSVLTMSLGALTITGIEKIFTTSK